GDPILMAHYFSSQSRGISSNDPDQKVIDKLEEDTEAAINNTYTIIRSRIDQFGVTSPNLQLQSGTGRILLELPGVKDPSRIKKLLRNSAKLEFRETIAYNDAKGALVEMDKVVKRIMNQEAGVTPPVAAGDTTKQDTSAATAAADSAGKAMN